MSEKQNDKMLTYMHKVNPAFEIGKQFGGQSVVSYGISQENKEFEACVAHDDASVSPRTGGLSSREMHLLKARTEIVYVDTDAGFYIRTVTLGKDRIPIRAYIVRSGKHAARDDRLTEEDIVHDEEEARFFTGIPVSEHLQ